MLITDEFITHAQNAPGKIALIMGDACLNYGDLLAAAQQVALAIDDTRSEHSKQRSEYFFDSPLVGLLTNNCIEFFEIFFGRFNDRRCGHGARSEVDFQEGAPITMGLASGCLIYQ